jgi:hypothetical protein
MDPDQTARMRRLVWINAGRKCITLVLSWRGSNEFIQKHELNEEQKAPLSSMVVFQLHYIY